MRILTDRVNMDVASITDARLKAGGARNIAEDLRRAAGRSGTKKANRLHLLAKADRLDAIALDIDDWADAA